jgi:hypothetical protein
MGARVITVAWLSALLLAGCSLRLDDFGLSAAQNSPASATYSPVAATDPAGPPPAAAPPSQSATVPLTDSDGNPACPATDAWGKDPSGKGVLVTVWSDRADFVTVLVRTTSGSDRAVSQSIGPNDRLRLFEFPDVDSTAVAKVLVMTNFRRCFSMMDPATAAS